MEHNVIPSGEIHTPFQWQPANAAARLAIVPNADDLHKIALQLDDHSQWVLTDDSPATWQAYGEQGPEGPEGPTGPTGPTGPAGPSPLINIQKFTASGTYTPTPGTASIIVELVGGGGGGGGTPTTPSGQVAAGGGGGSGGYVRGFFTTGFSGAAVVVGAAGAGVTGANGSSGTDTTFMTLTGAGGGGGIVNGPAIPPIGFSTGGVGGSASGGFLNVAGRLGGGNLGISTSVNSGGFGADSPIGNGGNAGYIGAEAGAATGYGAGGGGSAIGQSTGVTFPGANGSPGAVIIYEHGGVSPGGFSDSSGDPIDSAGDPIEDSSGDLASTTALMLVHADETTGTTTIDDVAGRSWVASGGAATNSDSAKWGGAGMKFTGTGWFQTADPFALGGTGEAWTIKLWVKTTQTSTACLVDNYHGPSGSWQVYIQSGTTLGFYSEGGSGPSATAPIFDGDRHFVAVVAYPGAGLAIYADENRIYYGPSSTALADYVGTHMRIGAQSNTGGNQFTGAIDEVCITDTADFSGATITVPTGPFT